MFTTAYRVTIAIRDAVRTVSAATEREVALMAESVLRQHQGETLAVGFWVDCADAEVGRRIAAYLTDLALELDLA
ncbi:hypothetical protein [Methylobacterium planeticum]|uniref:Uncharacterized protein n=1 Tax=Methylobacterium planeticum TaxID=2615211 RepID=A0A6N6MQT4_9HYPH|nr:hypothetical protein [Methylobacterium planeticum]KAB1072450.1 hypothetical protein F6X51_15780 [Methylobacterium planeticum]